MATRNIVPRATNEGSIGTTLKRWASGFIKLLTVDSVNKVTITPPATGATITITDTKTLSVTDDATLSGTNTGDQTLPVKATGAEINTGTNDDKFATPKAIADSNLVLASDVQSGSLIYAEDSGSTDAYAVTLSPAPSAYTAGMVVNFKANTVNTGACTINVNSLGVKDIKKNTDVDLVDGDIKAGQRVSLIYDGTNFQMLSPVANSGGIQNIKLPAFENIPNNTGVSLYNDNGTLKVRKVAETSNTEIAFGDAQSFYNGTSPIENATKTEAVLVDTNKVVVLYRDSSHYMNVRCATINEDNTFIWGTNVQVSAVSQSGYYGGGICALGTDKFAVVLKNSGGYTVVFVGTISGTTITLGSEQSTGIGGTSTAGRITAVSDSKIAVICYNSSNYPQVIVGTISGTTVSYGSVVEVKAAAMQLGACNICAVNTDKIVAIYASASAGYTYARVATISGTTLTFGTEATIRNSQQSYSFRGHIGIVKLDTDKFAVGMCNYQASGSPPMYQVFTCTGTTTITQGTVFETNPLSSSGDAMSADYFSLVSPRANVLVSLSSYEMAGTPLVVDILTVSGTSVSRQVANVPMSDTGGKWLVCSICAISDNTVMIVGRHTTPTVNGRAALISTVKLNPFFGIVSQGKSAGETAEVICVGGSVSTLTNITTGGEYFINPRTSSISSRRDNRAQAVAIGISSTSVIITRNDYYNKSSVFFHPFPGAIYMNNATPYTIPSTRFYMQPNTLYSFDLIFTAAGGATTTTSIVKGNLPSDSIFFMPYTEQTQAAVVTMGVATTNPFSCSAPSNQSRARRYSGFAISPAGGWFSLSLEASGSSGETDFAQVSSIYLTIKAIG